MKLEKLDENLRRPSKIIESVELKPEDTLQAADGENHVAIVKGMEEQHKEIEDRFEEKNKEVEEFEKVEDEHKAKAEKESNKALGIKAKNRAELAKIIEEAKANHQTFKIERSLEEGYRYVVTLSNPVELNESMDWEPYDKVQNEAIKKLYNDISNCKIKGVGEFIDEGDIHGFKFYDGDLEFFISAEYTGDDDLISGVDDDYIRGYGPVPNPKEEPERYAEYMDAYNKWLNGEEDEEDDFADIEIRTESLKEDINENLPTVEEELDEENTDTFTHKLYQVISQVVKSYKGRGVTKKDLESAMEFVQLHMEDDEELGFLAETLKEDVAEEEEEVEVQEEPVDAPDREESESDGEPIDAVLKSYEPWEGAAGTYKKIQEENKVAEFEELMKSLYPDGIDKEILDDFLAYNDQWLFDMLDIDATGTFEAESEEIPADDNVEVEETEKETIEEPKEGQQEGLGIDDDPSSVYISESMLGNFVQQETQSTATAAQPATSQGTVTPGLLDDEPVFTGSYDDLYPQAQGVK